VVDDLNSEKITLIHFMILKNDTAAGCNR
jgi:hypothetical protein